MFLKTTVQVLGTLLIPASFVVWQLTDQPKPKAAPPPADIWQDEEALAAHVRDHGLTATVDQLEALSAEHGNCHQLAHKAGRAGYQHFGPAVFREHGSACHSGSIHGAIEAYFRDQGTDRLAEKLAVICNQEQSAYYSDQCLHGVGHGLMAWSGYQLFDALASCDLIAHQQSRTACHSGVFMENVLSSIAGSHHVSSYLNDDLHYPCNAVDSAYQSTCYYFQPGRMIMLVGEDYPRLAKECLAVTAANRLTCAQSIGREAAWLHPDEASVPRQACAALADLNLRRACQVAALDALFGAPQHQARAAAYCAALADAAARSSCQEFVAIRAAQLTSL